MLPLTSGSGQRNLFLIQESTVLTSKCNSAPQAAVIPSAIMAENGIQGNQINRDVMDRSREDSNVCLHPLSLSHMHLSLSGFISLNYHTWMLNHGEQASVGYESVAHLQRGYMWVHANRAQHLHSVSSGLRRLCTAEMRRACVRLRWTCPPPDTDPVLPGIFKLSSTESNFTRQ